MRPNLWKNTFNLAAKIYFVVESNIFVQNSLNLLNFDQKVLHFSGKYLIE